MKYFLLLLHSLAWLISQAQIITVTNPSFEGTPVPHVTPAPWTPCFPFNPILGTGSGSPDTQPGIWGVTLPPSDGSSYVGFITNAGQIGEGVSQLLSSPMIANQTYRFSVDLAKDPTYSGAFLAPTHLEVYGTNSVCGVTELLWTSPLITNTGWDTHTIDFTPTANYTYVTINARYNTVASNILMDNLTPITPLLKITSKDVSCSGLCDGAATVIPGNLGALPYSFMWTGGKTTASLSNLCPGIYFVTVKNATGDFFNGTAIINTGNPLPIITANTSNSTLCAGDTINLNAAGGDTYTWLGDHLLNTTGDHTKASPTMAGNYTVTGTDTHGCYKNVVVPVTVYSLPVVTTSDVTICFADSAVLTASGALHYTWSGSSLLGYTNNYAMVNPSGSSTFSVTGTDNNGCSSLALAVVNVNHLPQVLLSPSDTIICEGEKAELFAMGADTYRWTPSQYLNTDEGPHTISQPPDSITYHVVGTDKNGCIDSAIVNIKVRELPIVIVSPDASICASSTAVLTANGAYTYVWLPDNYLNTTIGSTVLASPSATTSYTVHGTDVYGCTANARVTVQLPEIIFKGNVTALSGTSIVLYASGGDNYSWYPSNGLSCDDCPNPIANPEETTTYYVLITSVNKCQYLDSVTVVVKHETLFIANSFTPNNDGVNDIFLAYGKGVDVFEMIIYDRWGEFLFETHNIDEGWDGTFQHLPLPQGIYNYKIKYEKNGDRYYHMGAVVLIR